MSDNQNNQKIDSKDFLIGALVGGIVGATTALLLAPKSGKELRTNIGEQATQIKDKGSEITSRVREKSSAIVNTVSEQSNQVAGKVKELTSNIRRDISNWRSKGEEVKEKANDAYIEVENKIEDEVSREKDLVEQKY
ncbi:YtxH domain-containing protein [Fictibacillus gelatini]|uniref:YtxH domain-containing protein n=1 Tax=Fictibacillus gelatini TaxID=225985 RepID=UPI0004263C54|nr:YtxH domain-containing protein [Fictibacillus gelatini]